MVVLQLTRSTVPSELHLTMYIFMETDEYPVWSRFHCYIMKSCRVLLWSPRELLVMPLLRAQSLHRANFSLLSRNNLMFSNTVVEELGFGFCLVRGLLISIFLCDYRLQSLVVLFFL